MITLDSSGLIAIVDRDDIWHTNAMSALTTHNAPYIIPAQVMAEITYFIEREFNLRGLDDFLHDVESGGYTLDCGSQDIPRIRELVQRYADMPLGFADAAVIACAERNGRRVLTRDFRHFSAVARELDLDLLLSG